MTNRAIRIEDDDPQSVRTTPPQAWITYRKKNGQGAHSGTIATNPDYVKAHKDWVWLEIKLPPDSCN